ncbi:MAG: DUF3971 domain-containing protein [Rhodospirillaceae bacterium]|nr:DUF3971 domain-containing protein [Rhodospirillaceae bacterium]
MDFLASYISEAISNEREGILFEVQGASLAWGGMQSTPNITVRDIVAVDLDGTVIASFPEMLVRLSMASILEGSPAPEEIILDNPVVRLTRGQGGAILLGLELNYNTEQSDADIDKIEAGLTTNESANQLLNVVVKALIAPGGEDNRAGYLDRFVVQNSTVIFSDEASGSEWLVPSGDISLERQKGDLRISASLPFLNNGLTSRIEVGGVYAVDTSSLAFEVEFQDLRPSSLSVLSPQMSALSAMELDVDGKLELEILLLEALATVNRAQLMITSGEGVLALPAPISRTYPIAQFSMNAAGSDQLKKVTVSNLELILNNGGPEIELSLEGEQMLSNPAINLDIKIDKVGLPELKTYWPESVKPNTRRWIANNLAGGEVTDASFDLAITGSSMLDLETSSLAGSANLSGIDVTYLRQMPPVEDTKGLLRLSLSEVVIDIESGFVRLNSGPEKTLNVRKARVRLYGLDDKIDTADIDVRIDGQLADAIELIDRPPLGYASKLGITPTETNGLAEVLLSVDFPLVQGVSLDQVIVSATASLQQTSILDAAFGLDLESGQFRLDIDNLGMDVSGTASLGGIRTGLAWRENFFGGEFKRQYALDAVVENDQRPLIGLGQSMFSPPYVDGPIRLEAIYTVDESAESVLILEADLETAELSVPSLNWGKPIDTKGFVSAELLLSDGMAKEVRRFDVSSDAANLQFAGNIQFLGGVEIDSIRLEPGQIGSSQFEMNAARAEDGAYDISLRGKSLDGRSFWSSLVNNNSVRSFGATSQNASRIPFRFNGELERVLLSDLGGITNVSAKVVQNATGIAELVVNADVADTDKFTLTMQPKEQVREFRADSGNGGAVLQSLGLSDDFSGGELIVSGTVSETGAVSGILNIDSFQVFDAPLLARLLSVAALTGIVDELEGNGIYFSELNVPFTFTDGTFSIRDGAMYGPSLGLTAQGMYDTKKLTLDGQGTIVPVYAFNSALGGIPILGPLLTGGEESGGVFAATYAMRGNSDGGEITVNPLATLTPGFLRQIFRVFDPPPAVQVDSEAIEANPN